MYDLDNVSISAEIGMNPANGGYKIQAKFNNFHESYNNLTIESISLEIEEFIRMRNIILLLENQPQSLEEQTNSEDETELTYYEIGDYWLFHPHVDNKVKLFDKNSFMQTPAIFQINLCKFQQFFNRFNAAITYYVLFLEKYRNYASLVHSRIVKFYSNWLNVKEN